MWYHKYFIYAYCQDGKHIAWENIPLIQKFLNENKLKLTTRCPTSDNTYLQWHMLKVTPTS